MGDTHRLVARIAAFLSKGLLVAPHKPTVPRHKVAGVMDGERLLNMGDHEIIELSQTVSNVGTHTAWKPMKIKTHTRDLAPAETLAGVRGGKVCRHLTAWT